MFYSLIIAFQETALTADTSGGKEFAVAWLHKTSSYF